MSRGLGGVAAAPLTADVAAHVYRRTSFGPYPGQVAAAVDAGLTLEALVDQQAAKVVPFEVYAVWPELVSGELGTGDLRMVRGPTFSIEGPEPPELRWRYTPQAWWVDRMLHEDVGLHEKMMWVWHGIFTCSAVKVDRITPLFQHEETLHRHAMGSFRDLAIEINKGGAMLCFLDGNNSNVNSGPNENHARELMELFTLGIDQYTQADVVAAARVLAGWSIDQDNRLTFHPDRAITSPETVLGVKGVKTTEDLVDAVLEQDACAPHVVGRIWRSLIGGAPDQGAIARWAKSFRASGYEIAPLVRTMLTSDEFVDAVNARARTAIEWYCAAVSATGDAPLRITTTDLTPLGQLPFGPPNVSGWPGDSGWLTGTQLRARSQIVSDLQVPIAADLGGSDDVVAAALAQASLPTVSDETRTSLAKLDAALVAASASPEDRGRAVLSAALLSPEFSLA